MTDAPVAYTDLQPADERIGLCERLDYYRGIVASALAGRTWEQASSRPLPATKMTMAGIVRHLAWAEDRWFQGRLLGLPMPSPWDAPGADDPDAAMLLASDDTVDGILELYAGACARSRRVVADAASFSQVALVSSFGVGPVNLRWIMVHMIDETARHAGHLDVMGDVYGG